MKTITESLNVNMKEPKMEGMSVDIYNSQCKSLEFTPELLWRSFVFLIVLLEHKDSKTKEH